MDQRRIGLESDLVARTELMPLTKYGDDLLAAELGKYLRLRSGRLDDHDLGFGTVIGDRGVLGSDAIPAAPGGGVGGPRPQRHLRAVRPSEGGPALRLHFTLEEIHRRRAD